MATQICKYAVFGVNGLAGTVGLVTANKIYIESAEFERGSDEKKLINNSGDTAGVVVYNNRDTLSIVMRPIDSASVANAAANWVSPAIGALCTITADTSVEPANALEFAGNNWRLTRSRKQMQADDYAMWTLEFERNPLITA